MKFSAKRSELDSMVLQVELHSSASFKASRCFS